MKNIDFPDGIPKEYEIETLKHRLYYWYPCERIGDIGFWINDYETVEYSKLIKKNTERQEVLKQLNERGFHIYVADITLPEIRDRGFQVLKIAIPELHPLYLCENAKSLYSAHHGAIPDDPSLKPHPLT